MKAAALGVLLLFVFFVLYLYITTRTPVGEQMAAVWHAEAATATSTPALPAFDATGIIFTYTEEGRVVPYIAYKISSTTIATRRLTYTRTVDATPFTPYLHHAAHVVGVRDLDIVYVESIEPAPEDESILALMPKSW